MICFKIGVFMFVYCNLQMLSDCRSLLFFVGGCSYVLLVLSLLHCCYCCYHFYCWCCYCCCWLIYIVVDEDVDVHENGLVASCRYDGSGEWTMPSQTEWLVRGCSSHPVPTGRCSRDLALPKPRDGPRTPPGQQQPAGPSDSEIYGVLISVTLKRSYCRESSLSEAQTALPLRCAIKNSYPWRSTHSPSILQNVDAMIQKSLPSIPQQKSKLAKSASSEPRSSDDRFLRVFRANVTPKLGALRGNQLGKWTTAFAASWPQVCENRTVVVRFLILRWQFGHEAGAWQIEREMMKINDTK